MSDDSTAAGDFLRGLSEPEYSRISALLDDSLDMIPSDREIWLATLERSDPKSAAILRGMFSAQVAYAADNFLEDMPSVPADPGLGSDATLIGKQFGPYRVLSLLGRGGMGSVWLAERSDGLFKVALKLVHSALVNAVTAERFAREREILASLSHPNIARLLDAGIADDGQPYLALEYIVGTPIATYCDERSRSLAQRLALFQQVLAAVQYAHGHLVIHRDLKSSNILVSEDGQVHLLDFGIAKLLGDGQARETELTQLGGRALTPDFAAPEQILGHAVSTAADVYSLGVLLYGLLTAERPYRLKLESRGALEQAILESDPVPPSRAALTESAAANRVTTVRKLTATLQGDLDTIVLKALKKIPADRYTTVNAFAQDIGRYLAGEPVLAQRDTLHYRALKFTRRHWVGIGVGSALLLTLLAGLAATTYEARIAARQRDNALEASRRSLTQTAAARLQEGDVSGALNIILDVLSGQDPYTPEALNVLQEARAADVQILAITGHTDRVRSAAISADGRVIATASFDNTARLWDAQTGQEIRQLGIPGDHFIQIVFSRDGRRIATASYDKTARLWDARTGQLLRVFTGHADRLRSVAFSPDGGRLVTGSYDRTARIWDVATGKELQVLTGHDEVVSGVNFSPDGTRLVTGSYDKTVRIWNVATGRELKQLPGHTDRVTSVEFSPDGMRVLTASGDKSARIWEVASGRELVQLRGHTQLLAAATFSSDGKTVITAAYDRTARIWDSATGQQLFLLAGHTDTVESAVFSTDGSRAITASSDRTVRIWDMVGKRIKQLEGHADAITNAMYSHDGRRIITSSFDKTARIWDAVTGRTVQELVGHRERVTSAALSFDGRRAVTTSTDKTARIWDVQTGRELVVLQGHTEAVFSAAFSPDGQRVVTAGLDKTARIWDVATGRLIRILEGHGSAVENAFFSFDGRRIVTSSNDKTARIWDALTGQQLTVFSGHTDVVERAEFSPDGTRIITASDDKTARVWDVATGQELLTLNGHSDQVPNASMSRDGLKIVTSSTDRTARIWNATTGEQLLVLRHPDQVEGATFSSDGERIVTASDDGVARIWDVRVTPIVQQIRWIEAAQFDSLDRAQRFALGLLTPTNVRPWITDHSKCDETAGAPYDPDRRAPGVAAEQIVGDIAIQACGTERQSLVGEPRWVYEHGRALMATGDLPGARHAFERAIDGKYRAARVDLAMLLVKGEGEAVDFTRAVSLLEKAWADGVTFAGFQLGHLYEGRADLTRAWTWYERAAKANEPHSLGRLADREAATAVAQTTASSRRDYWVSAFKYYAAAAERARSEDWPDDVWATWRYRRASLARILEREGMMQQVGDAFAAVRKMYERPTRSQ
jgi:eukaryotic-like serine/threonine-protein kinase